MSSLGEPKESVNSYHPDGPASYLDLGAHSPAKYPAPDKKRKAKKMSEVPKMKARMNLTLDLLQKEGLSKPKVVSRVRCQERVLLKEIKPDTESWTTVPLEGFSTPCGLFFQKRQEIRRQMKR